MYSTIQNRQTNIFQRANTIENQLNNLFHRINDIQRIKTKLIDSHINIERKLKQINDLISTTNTDENQERLILIQVNN
jgi:predicted  nucleic acid-binding Zn-ribbon protein